MNKMIGVNLFTNKFLRNSLRIIAIMCILLAFTAGVSAENNTSTITPPITLVEDETPVEEVVYYRDTEQYQTDYNTYYEHYKSLQDSETVQNLRSLIYNYLVDSSLSWESKQAVILPLMGWDYRLEYYMNKPDKYTVDDSTGEITWDLGVGNWWLKLFGSGVQESLLPQNIAEGDALYQTYVDVYDEYVTALHDAGDP